MSDNELEPCSSEFKNAVQRHQEALSEFGEGDPRTIEAIFAVMLLAPDWLFYEMEEIALAPRH